MRSAISDFRLDDWQPAYLRLVKSALAEERSNATFGVISVSNPEADVVHHRGHSEIAQRRLGKPDGSASCRRPSISKAL